MRPQPHCCLPWCGASFPPEPSHSRKFRIAGRLVRLTYPAMIDMHDVTPRSLGGDPYDLENQRPLCHCCHMAHENGVPGMRLTFGTVDGRDYAYREDGKEGFLVAHDPDCEVA